MLSDSTIKDFDNVSKLIEKIEKLNQDCDKIADGLQKFLFHHLVFGKDEQQILKEAQEKFLHLYRARLADALQLFYSAVNSDKLKVI